MNSKKAFPGRSIMKWILSILAAIAIWPIAVMIISSLLWLILSVGLIGYMAYRIHEEIDG